VTSVSISTPVTRRRPAFRTGVRPVVSPGPANEGARRALNVLVAVIGLVLAAPFMMIVAVALKLTSRGPVLYTQTRVGVDRRSRRSSPDISRRETDIGGRPFKIYKFRTMATRPGTEHQELWAAPDDPRVTPLGRVLRQFRIDELPQLWNVLRGDMNVVGPRPEQPSIFVDLREQINGYHHRQRVRPGITGWAQVNHTYDRCIEDVKDKVSLDLEYIGRQSLAEDLKIMAMTVPVMVFRKGAW